MLKHFRGITMSLVIGMAVAAPFAVAAEYWPHYAWILGWVGGCIATAINFTRTQNPERT
jgi:hypothetical protein